MEGSELIRVLVVDDHRVVREGLRSYLELVDDIEIVGEASDGRAALDWLARAKAQGGLPDVVLMDLMMEPMNGIDATATVKERYPDIQVVAVTSFVEEEKVHAALEAGAAGTIGVPERVRPVAATVAGYGPACPAASLSRPQRTRAAMAADSSRYAVPSGNSITG